MTNQKETACGGSEVRREVSLTEQVTLEQVLERIQRMWIRDRFFLMTEDWDWIVVLQCMQDHGLFKSNPKRVPFGAFVTWLKEHKVPQYLTKYSVRNLRHVNKRIAGARHPWSEVTWDRNVPDRWRIIYANLERMFKEIQDTSRVAE